MKMYALNDIVLYKGEPKRIVSLSNEYVETYIKLEDIYSNILQNGVEPIEISKSFLMKNDFVLKKLLVTFDKDKFDKFVYLNDGFVIELYISEKNDGLNVTRLVIHKNNTGNMIDVKLNYVHELQQAFRMCNLQYVADNFKI